MAEEPKDLLRRYEESPDTCGIPWRNAVLAYLLADNLECRAEIAAEKEEHERYMARQEDRIARIAEHHA